jgi:hypothetical protein
LEIDKDLIPKTATLNELCTEIWPKMLDLAIEITEYELTVGYNHQRDLKNSIFLSLYEECLKFLEMANDDVKWRFYIEELGTLTEEI